jgi:hypothetical protein
MNASGRWYLPEGEDKNKDEYADLSTEEIRRRAETQLATDSAERAQIARNAMLQKFFNENDTVPLNDRNAALLEVRLRDILSSRGEVWPRYSAGDLQRAADSLHEEGCLQTTGKYHPKTLTEESAESLSTAEILKRVRGF